MMKVGRNELCPCGSGLKYKKCCLKKNIIPYSPEELDNKLLDLSLSLIDYGITNYKQAVNESLGNYTKQYDLLDSPEDKDHFIKLTLPWILIHEKIVDGVTIYDKYVEEQLPLLQHPDLEAGMKQWPKGVSSIFRLETVIDAENYFVSVRDVFTDKQYDVKLNGMTEDNVDTYIVGTILYAHTTHYFYYISIALPNSVETWIAEKKAQNYKMNDDFIPAVAQLLKPQEVSIEWADQSYEAVAEMFVAKVADVPKEAIDKTVSFWHDFSTKEKPIVRKEAAIVAALEYFLDQQLNDGVMTQKQLAEKYDVASTTISNHYHKFLEQIND